MKIFFSLLLVFFMISQLPGVNLVKDVGHKLIPAKVGDGVILPCHLEPPFDVNSLTIEWRFQGQIILVYRNGAKDDKTSDPMYEGRTSLFHDEFKKGNISLKLNNVSKEDGGNYTCFVPDLQSQVKEGNVTLYVGEVVGHEPIQAEVGDDVTLPCHLDPPFDVNNLTIEWRFQGQIILVRQSQAKDDKTSDPKYKNRTFMFHDEFEKGNISLKLNNVSKEDGGNYTCFVPKLQSKVRKGNVTLYVDENVAQENVIGPRGTDELALALALGLGLGIPAIIISVYYWQHRQNGIENGNPPADNGVL